MVQPNTNQASLQSNVSQCEHILFVVITEIKNVFFLLGGRPEGRTKYPTNISNISTNFYAQWGPETQPSDFPSQHLRLCPLDGMVNFICKSLNYSPPARGVKRGGKKGK